MSLSRLVNFVPLDLAGDLQSDKRRHGTGRRNKTGRLATVSQKDCKIFPKVVSPHVWRMVKFSPVGVRSIAISMYVGLFACLFVCPLAYLKNNTSKCHHISCMFSVPSSDANTIRYVLPVLWMTSCHVFT